MLPMRDTKPKFKPGEKDSKPADGAAEKKGYALKGRLWIDGPEGTFLGVGRIVLLERIKEHGSLIAAARSMNMSYRHAWDLLDSIGRQAKKPLFTTGRGGREGGGTRLTGEGEKIIAAFWKLNGKFRKFLEKEMKNLGI